MSANIKPLQDATDEITTLLGLQPIQVYFRIEYTRNMRPVLGRAHYRARQISIHPDMVGDEVMDTLKHELAHFMSYDLDGHTGHGWIWRMHAKALGCDPHAIRRSTESAFRQ